MGKWTFYGRVIPACPAINIQTPEISFLSSDGEESKVRLFIHNSQIIAWISDSHDDVYTSRNTVEAEIRSIFDFTGFSTGMSFDIEIASGVNDSEEGFVFGADIPFLHQKKGGGVSIDTDDLIHYLGDIPSKIALADFREAMKIPVQTGFFCYRAIEALMQSFNETGTSDGKGAAWNALRNALNVDKSAIDHVKSYADWARHGQPGSISGIDRVNLFNLTDDIIGRYLIFSRANRVSLSKVDYPPIVYPTVGSTGEGARN